MKIAVLGAGAMGCYFGGKLAKSGVDVSFIARGAHLDAMRKNGLAIESPLGDFKLDKVEATDNPADIGPVDIVLFLVKLPDTREAASKILPLLHEDTGIVSFQNGVEAWDLIGEVVGKDRVVGGTATIPAVIREPGIVHHSADFAKLVLGEFGRRTTQRSEQLLKLFRNAGVDAELVNDIDVKIWEKFVMLSAFSAATALMRLPIGPVRDNAKSKSLLEQLVSETFVLGQKACPDLPADHAAKVLQFLYNAPAGMRSSMLDDLNRGKPLEVDFLSGAVVRKSSEHGLEAPAHAFVQQSLAPFSNGPPKLP